MFNRALAFLAAAVFSLSALAAGPDAFEGHDYTIVKNPQPVATGNKVEVLEFFWYRCPHCFQLEPLTYAPWGMFPNDSLVQRRKQCIASLKEAVKVAEDNGVLLCMEVVNRFEGYLINTVQQGLEIISEVQSNYLRLHLDSFSFEY